MTAAYYRLPGGGSILKSLRRIISACGPRITAADAVHPFTSAANRAVFSNRQDEILAAAGVITTYGRQHRPKTDLVKPHSPDQEGGEPGPERSCKPANHEGPASRASFRAI